MQRLSSRESVMQGLCKLALDFQAWVVPESKSMYKWTKDEEPIVICEGRLIDDVNAQIDSYRRLGAESAYLPRLLVAVQRIKELPDNSQIYGVPYDLKTRIPTDPQKRNITLRALPRAFRVQFAFLVNEPDTAQSFADQFCSYVLAMEKRRITVEYHFADDVKDDWHLTIFDNSLFPDTASIEEKNIHIGLLDFTIAGLLPQVTSGLPNYFDEAIKPSWEVVVEADMFKGRPSPTFVRLKADKLTGERSQETIVK